MFKLGDYVQLKKAITIETNEVVDHWSGKITEIYEAEKICSISFDAPTLLSLSDAYIIDCGEDYSPLEYNLPLEEIELIERKDTDEALQNATEKIYERQKELGIWQEDDESGANEKEVKQLISHYTRTQFYNQLTDLQKESAGFIISATNDYLDGYHDVWIGDCNTYALEDVCLDVVPRKVSAELAAFEVWADVLISFFQYLDSIDYIDNARKLIQVLRQIRNEIPKIAGNPNNWGIAKTFIMAAENAGVDPTDINSLNEFLASQDLNISDSIQSPVNDEFKDFQRNQRVSVKYTDGRIVENVKFKKVEHDLLDGKCTLI